MQLTDFNFDLPTDAIAHYPLQERSESRLLCLSGDGREPTHKRFSDIVELIHPGDLLVFNDTKVLPARLMGYKDTGGKVNILVERILDAKRFTAQVKTSKALRLGSCITLANTHVLEVVDRHDHFYEFHYHDKSQTVLTLLSLLGEIPLPPYLSRAAEELDKTRYQTIYARHDGSVAAPTAGLHFDEAILSKLQKKNIEMAYLTLHIGAGTFVPVRVENIKEHKMHKEFFDVSETLCQKIHATKAMGKRVIAVGTTTLRALEATRRNGRVEAYRGETNIFITPGYQFNSADVLITNLHLPKSTLLMLVSAFGGYQEVMQAYRAAISSHYRFYSYGDAMWVPCLHASTRE